MRCVRLRRDKAARLSVLPAQRRLAADSLRQHGSARQALQASCQLRSAVSDLVTSRSAQSNLGRGPRRGAVAHVVTYAVLKSPLVAMARPKFAPKSTPSRGRIPKPRCLPHAWTRPTYGDKRHPDPIPVFHNALDRPTHTRTTDRQADRSSTGKFDDYRPLRYDSDAA